MSWTLDNPPALRAAVMWLSVACAVLVPASFAAPASGSSDACPCEAAHADHLAEDAAHVDPAEDAAEGNRDECPDECPSDCANCSCCASVATALPPLSLPVAETSFVELADVLPGDSPASGVATNVFRPPRALT